MNVIITGASQGIGAGIATFLGREGFRLGLLARSEDLLRSVQSSVEQSGGVCHTAPCDLRDPDATAVAIGGLIEALGGVDALINNAGVVIRKNAFEISFDEWHAMIDTNVNGLFYSTRAVLPHLRDQKRGWIINVASISGHVPLPGGSGYAASKYAVVGFSESLLHEVRDYGIHVTTMFPGSVDSQSHRHEDEDTSWKVKPEEVGQACRDVLRSAPGTCISQLEIRPLRRPPR